MKKTFFYKPTHENPQKIVEQRKTTKHNQQNKANLQKPSTKPSIRPTRNERQIKERSKDTERERECGVL